MDQPSNNPGEDDNTINLFADPAYNQAQQPQTQPLYIDNQTMFNNDHNQMYLATQPPQDQQQVYSELPQFFNPQGQGFMPDQLQMQQFQSYAMPPMPQPDGQDQLANQQYWQPTTMGNVPPIAYEFSNEREFGYAREHVAGDDFMISFNTVPPPEKKQKKNKKSRKRDRNQVSFDQSQYIDQPQYVEMDNNTITLFGQQQAQPPYREVGDVWTVDQHGFGKDDKMQADDVNQNAAGQETLPNNDFVQLPQQPHQFAQPQYIPSNQYQPLPEATPSHQLMEDATNEQQQSFIQLQMAQNQQQAMMMVPTYMGDVVPTPLQIDEKKEKKLNLMKIYTLKSRSLALQLDPDLCRYQGQITFELELNEALLKEKIFDKIEKFKVNGFSKIHLEAKFICKQAQIINAFLLEEGDSDKAEQRKKKMLSLKNTGLNLPEEQADFQQRTFGGQSRNIFQYEQTVRSEFVKQLKNGTCHLNKKVCSIKLRKALDKAKYKPKYTMVVSFFCDQVTDVGGIRVVKYLRDREARLSNQAKTGSYFYTNDHYSQSEAWLPKIVGTQSVSTPWTLKFVVPKEYMIIASGKQILREIDAEGFALHEYELNFDEQTTPDRIGFIAVPFPEITPFDISKSTSKVYACFVSKTKQQNLSPKLIPEIIDFITGILMKPYPCRESQLVFVPNLFPHKHSQQSLNFAGGLHILDQELLFRPNQLDKRHHAYKHITSALTYDFFGNIVKEGLPSDAWLIVAIRERFGDRFKKKRCGTLLYRYHVMRSIEKLYKQMKQGLETAPLQRAKTQANDDEPDEVYRLGYAHPAEQNLNDIFYRKCGLIMHMIESNIDESNLDKIFREMYWDALAVQDPSLRTIDQLTFRKKFRKVCGMQPVTVFTNWIWATSCPKLELSYEFNKRNNSLDLQLKQTSAASYNLKGRKMLETKLNKIFGASNSTIQRELYGELPSGLDTFYVDEMQAQRRWFVGDINIVIYQVEGSGGDILKQQHKMQLKEFKTSVSAHIPLQGRVKRTMPTKKKEFDLLPFTEDQNLQTAGGNIHMQAAQMVLNNDVWKFEMNEFELEDFPQETKNIFTTRELENNPVLWIRVDPDMEYIRQVKVIQDKKVHWLFQLLRENDIIGQIEAVNQLHKYNSELVYEILKTVSKNENYFFKVRKCVLKALQKMEVSQINKWLSHEAFLIRAFNKKNFDESTGFYKVNNFSNLLEYYLDRSILKAISKCKEEKLRLKADKDAELQELRRQRDKSDTSFAEAENVSEMRKVDQTMEDMGTIQLDIVASQLVSVTTRPVKRPKLIDESLYRVTTDAVAKMLFKVLEQNDNSENTFDDSFLIRDLLASLGRLDNLAMMPKIAAEIYRQFRLDQISNSSPWHAITVGAIQAYFNMQKQIWRFRELKHPNIDTRDRMYSDQEEALKRTESILDGLKNEINGLMADPDQSLDLRLFIFSRQIRHLIFFRNLPLVKALVAILEAIYNLQSKLQIRFAYFCLQELAHFLEAQKFVGKLNMTELFIDNALTRRLMDTMWAFICLPHGYLTHELNYWIKRIIQRIYGPTLPEFLRVHDPHGSAFVPKYDYIWSQTEQKLAQEEQFRLTQADQQKTSAAQQSPFLPVTDEIVLENIAFDPAKKTQHGGSKLRTQVNEIIVRTSDELYEQIAPEQRLQYMMDEPFSQMHQQDIDFYRKGPLGEFVINAGDQSARMHGPYSNNDGVITLHAVNNTRRERYNSDQFEMEPSAFEGDQKQNQYKDSNDLIEISKERSDYGDQEDSEQESEYDPFQAISFEDPVVQACWLILGELYYHYDATDFLEPVSVQTLGEDLFEEYCQLIRHPMDIGTVMQKMQTHAYRGDMSLFIADVERIFDNCREFNEQGTEIYNCANVLTEFFKQQLQQKGLIS